MSGAEGKVVVITGARSGIGEATALLLAERGAKVVLGARGRDRLAMVADRIVSAGGDAAYAPTDVKRRDDVRSRSSSTQSGWSNRHSASLRSAVESPCVQGHDDQCSLDSVFRVCDFGGRIPSRSPTACLVASKERRPRMESETVAQLLQQWRTGDEGAYARLIPVVYDELRRLARAQLRGERAGHSVQPTLLVHEAYLRLVKADVDWRDRTHFLSVAARVMRRILVERARAKRATKRGGDEVRVPLSGPIPSPQSSPIDILVLDDAMERLRGLNERQAQIAELCFFGGLTYAEIGETIGISEATVDRDLRHARAWLRRELSAP